MNYIQFKKEFYDQICFTSNQVYAWLPNFDKNNLGRWVKKGYLVKLKNGFYLFPEQLDKPNINFYVANRMYMPSYISLHTALAFHGLIPESVTQTTSVSTLKTKQFNNPTGYFSYKNVKTKLFFGYKQLPFSKDKSVLVATPEKAIIDLLYLYKFYDNPDELTELRLNDELLHELINKQIIDSYLQKIDSAALNNRVNMLLRVYKIS